MTRRILVIRGGAIGDFIVTLPVLAALREAFPEAAVEVMGYSHITRLATAAGLAEEARPIESRAMAGFFARGGRLDTDLEEYFLSFDIIISFLFDPDQIFRRNLARASQARIIQGLHRPEESSPLHASHQMLQALDDLCPIRVPLPLRLAIPAAPRTPAGTWLALHPGSGSPRKNWPAEKWNALLALLARKTDWRFLLIAGEAEGSLVERLASTVDPGRIQIARNRPLDELASELGSVSIFIGHDSGITHIAAAVGAPSLALWGPTSAEVWAPAGPNARVLSPPGGLETLDPQTVFDALIELNNSLQ